MTRGQFAHRLFKRLGVPKTLHNRRALAAWIQSEGGNARNNPLNTTQDWDGATNFNSVGVKDYPSEEAGVAATAKTFGWTGHNYEAILRDLRQNADAEETLDAVAASDWGTGALPHTILEEIRRQPDYLRTLEQKKIAG